MIKETYQMKLIQGENKIKEEMKVEELEKQLIQDN